MKSLAAVNIRHYERAVESLEHYRAVVDRGWEVFFRSGIMTKGKPRGDKAVCMVVGSDQGMCGQFNELLAFRAVEETAKISDRLPDTTFWSMGEKVHATLLDMGHTVGKPFSAPGSLSGIEKSVQVMLQEIESWRASTGSEQVFVCHNLLAAKGGGYEPAFYRLLPLDRRWVDEFRTRKWSNRCIPMMGLSTDTMFFQLFRQHLFVSLYQAFAQSMASENAARLMAMQAAEKNIEEKKEELSRMFRDQRQANITNELLDIISGFEALTKRGGGP